MSFTIAINFNSAQNFFRNFRVWKFLLKKSAQKSHIQMCNGHLCINRIVILSVCVIKKLILCGNDFILWRTQYLWWIFVLLRLIRGGIGSNLNQRCILRFQRVFLLIYHLNFFSSPPPKSHPSSKALVLLANRIFLLVFYWIPETWSVIYFMAFCCDINFVGWIQKKNILEFQISMALS